MVKTARDVFRPVSELFKGHVSFSPKTRRKEILLPPLESTLSTEMRLRRRDSGAVQVCQVWVVHVMAKCLNVLPKHLRSGG
ncbi:hypothetical protein F383_31974 [Gossypium arboreum]|uniref:Uncharacterized protein n=1 Tax=Gossypium arboreum TaxID=29729 RepID=A0A0B0N4D3_GOSAR|nr:hypothetical protein F383_31974 [Gossypium arboreum]